MSRWVAAGLVILGLAAPPRHVRGSDDSRRLRTRARAHLAAGRCHDAESTLLRLVHEYPGSSEALEALRDLGRLGKLRHTPDAAARVLLPVPHAVDATSLVEMGLPLAAVARSGSVTNDPELAVLLARALAREPAPPPQPVMAPMPPAAGAKQALGAPGSRPRGPRAADGLLQRVVNELETAERTLALGRATLGSPASASP